jgi:hypothetical protein
LNVSTVVLLDLAAALMKSRWHDDGADDFDFHDRQADDAWDDDGGSESLDPAEEFVSCPQCGADVAEEALRCAVCGQWMPQPPGVFAGRPWWWVALGLLGIAATLITLAFAHGAPRHPPRDGDENVGGGMVRHFV